MVEGELEGHPEHGALGFLLQWTRKPGQQWVGCGTINKILEKPWERTRRFKEGRGRHWKQISCSIIWLNIYLDISCPPFPCILTECFRWPCPLFRPAHGPSGEPCGKSPNFGICSNITICALSGFGCFDYFSLTTFLRDSSNNSYHFRSWSYFSDCGSWKGQTGGQCKAIGVIGTESQWPNNSVASVHVGLVLKQLCACDNWFCGSKY